MAEMHTDRGNSAVFLWNLSVFLFHFLRLSLLGSKSSLVYIISEMPMQSSWSYLLPMHCTSTCLLSSMPPMQLTWHFCCESSCIIFTITIYVACQRESSGQYSNMYNQDLALSNLQELICYKKNNQPKITDFYRFNLID